MRVPRGRKSILKGLRDLVRRQYAPQTPPPSRVIITFKGRKGSRSFEADLLRIVVGRKFFRLIIVDGQNPYGSDLRLAAPRKRLAAAQHGEEFTVRMYRNGNLVAIVAAQIVGTPELEIRSGSNHRSQKFLAMSAA